MFAVCYLRAQHRDGPGLDYENSRKFAQEAAIWVTY
jgi:hypothetical protein